VGGKYDEGIQEAINEGIRAAHTTIMKYICANRIVSFSGNFYRLRRYSGLF